MEPQARNVFSPSQLNALARDMLEGTFPSIWVEGELGNVSRPASGHLYLTLKDERAQVRAAMFKPKAGWLKFVPREGMRVLARGRLTLYEARGEYQMVLDHLEEAGEGALRLAYERLRQRLQAEGLFDADRKRALPRFVRRVAILTSPRGAAIHDVVSVFARRWPLLEVEVLPVPVQGEGAAAQVTRVLQRATGSGRYDALLVTRGGGSLEDLWAFNDEALARAIAGCAIPVVAAIGHESDVTLAELAADLRAPTPSVAAELLVPDALALRATLQRSHQRLRQLQANRLHQASQRLDRAFLRLQAARPQARLALMARRAAALRERLQAVQARALLTRLSRLRRADAVLRAEHPAWRIEQARSRVTALQDRRQRALARRLHGDALHLRGLARALEAVSPLATVARGYSILLREDGSILRRVADAREGEALQARLIDGHLPLRVDGLPAPEH